VRVITSSCRLLVAAGSANARRKSGELLRPETSDNYDAAPVVAERSTSAASMKASRRATDNTAPVAALSGAAHTPARASSSTNVRAPHKPADGRRVSEDEGGDSGEHPLVLQEHRAEMQVVRTRTMRVLSHALVTAIASGAEQSCKEHAIA
jgi:hypothetical protein